MCVNLGSFTISGWFSHDTTRVGSFNSSMWEMAAVRLQVKPRLHTFIWRGPSDIYLYNFGSSLLRRQGFYSAQSPVGFWPIRRNLTEPASHFIPMLHLYFTTNATTEETEHSAQFSAAILNLALCRRREGLSTDETEPIFFHWLVVSTLTMSRQTKQTIKQTHPKLVELALVCPGSLSDGQYNVVIIFILWIRSDAAQSKNNDIKHFQLRLPTYSSKQIMNELV